MSLLTLFRRRPAAAPSAVTADDRRAAVIAERFAVHDGSPLNLLAYTGALLQPAVVLEEVEWVRSLAGDRNDLRLLLWLAGYVEEHAPREPVDGWP